MEQHSIEKLWMIYISQFLIFVGGMAWAHFAAKKSIKNNPPVSLQEPHGIGGVLAFFIFVSTYIAPFLWVGVDIKNLIDVENEHPRVLSMSGWVWYKFSLICAAGVWGFWQWRVARKLHHRLVPASINAVKLFLIGAALFPLVDYLLVSLFLKAADAAESIKATNRALFINFLWFCYFCFSKRVKNTYYGSSSETKLAL